jgi:two-component sensor histidine kinase
LLAVIGTHVRTGVVRLREIGTPAHKSLSKVCTPLPFEKIGTDIEEDRARLARSLAEKDVLLKEVHHRVKNNLQIIASLLRMQAQSSQNPELAAALRDSQNRVESMALIHEQLYESGDLREVDVAHNTSMLISHLLHSFGIDPARVTGRVSIQPFLLNVVQAIPVGLILNELISNALKHAFPDTRQGSIVVEGRTDRGAVHLSVRDDGVGLPPGFDVEKTEGSLGLRIVSILVRQLKGSLHVARANGSVFRIRFPQEVR